MPGMLIGGIVFLVVSAFGGYALGRHDGAAGVRAKWEAEKVAVARESAALALRQGQVSAKIEAEQRVKVAEYEERIRKLQAGEATLRKRVATLVGENSELRVSRDYVRVYNDAVAGATAAAAAREPDAKTPPPAPDSSVAAVAEVALVNVERHRACIEQVLGWQNFWRELERSYSKGLSND